MKWIGLSGILKKVKKISVKGFLLFFTLVVNSLIFATAKVISVGLKKILIIGFVFGSATLGCLTWYCYKIYNEDVDLKQLTEYRPVMSSRILDSNDNLIADIAKEKRIFVPIDKISKNIVHAFISAEDRTFYQNNGLDIHGFTRAMIMNVWYLLNGKRFHGASTITQQVVRNTILSNERTITRKLKEMVISYKVAKITTKDQIMEVYLNHIYLGQKAYGVEAAALEYFGKKSSDLNIAEAALIASLTKAPSDLDPRKNKPATINRRNWIIKSMNEEGYISEQDASEAIASSIDLVPKKTIEKKAYSYIDYILRYLEINHQITKSDLENNGYTIKTTFEIDTYNKMYDALNNGIIAYDKKYGYRGSIASCAEDFKKCFADNQEQELLRSDQKIAIIKSCPSDEICEIIFKDGSMAQIKLSENLWAKKSMPNFKLGPELKKMSDILNVGDIVVVKSHNQGFVLDQIPQINGAAVVLSPKDGKVIGMIGGYMDVPGAFNRVIQAKRQPGSLAKIFSLVVALESGFKLNDLIFDSEIQIPAGNGTMWAPKNATNDFSSGPITVRRAFERSLNAPIARIMYEAGISKLVSLLVDLKISENPEQNLSTCLGSFDSTLMGISLGFSTVINSGNMVEDSPIISIFQNEVGMKYNREKRLDKIETIEEISDDESYDLPSRNGVQKIKPTTAYQVASVLEGAVLRGTAGKMASVAPNLFGKTGTSNDAKDLWFVGGSQDFVVGVYIGKDKPESLGNNEFGGTAALPIAKEILSDLVKKKKPEPLHVPDGLKFINVEFESGKVADSGGKQKRMIKEVFLASDKIEDRDVSDIVNSLEADDESVSLTGVY